MKVGARIRVLGNSGFSKEVEAAEKELSTITSISQYTDIEAALSILLKREIKTNSILKVDDIMERRYLQDMIDNDEATPYVACFDCGENENIALWHMYTQGKYGVKICFEFLKKYAMKDLIDFSKPVNGYRNGYDKPDAFYYGTELENQKLKYPKVKTLIRPTKVIYKDKVANGNVQLPASNMINETLLASVKAKEWFFQNEVRYVMYFEHTDVTAFNDSPGIIEIPRFDFFLVPIRFDILNRVVLTFSPWMEKNTKEMMREKLEHIKLDCELEFEDSKFDGTIERK